MDLAEIIERTEFEPVFHEKQRDCWVAFLDRELNIVSSNDAWRLLFGPAVTEVRGRRLGDVVNLAPLTSLIVSGFCFRSEPVRILGKKVLCSYVPILEGQRATGGFLSVAVARDDTGDEIWDAPDNLARSLGPLIDIIQDGLIVVNRVGIITLVNQHFADAVGTRAQDMIGKHITRAYSNSRVSRLPVVMETGKAEIGWPHLINGKDVVACRYPLFRDGKVIGALGRIMYRDVREVTLLANQINSLMGKGEHKPVPISKHCDFNYDINSIIGHSKVMAQIKETLLRIADRGSNVLIIGESGTGKELFAHSIHAASRRRYGPFIKVNCAAIPEHLLESELFGYVEGAFTGAKRGGQLGKFELAHTGTLFLDEIGDMPLAMQAKLLRVLQEKEITPLGSDTTKTFDVRVVAATNANLEQLVEEGRFRKDLYFRLNIVSLVIPPLRERAEDLYYIVKHFVDRFNDEFGLRIQGLDPEAWDALKGYGFPGNLRELRNVIESAFNVVVGPYIKREHLPDYLTQACGFPRVATSGRPLEGDYGAQVGRRPLQEIMDAVEKNLIEQAIDQAGGNKLAAAALLGISRPGLYKKIQRHGIHYPLSPKHGEFKEASHESSKYH
ncbi:sigma-54 interaction domain-containing protein [Geoalkalibacter halelectricus]|uniref:Sigma 54-interacting transcriptional regulator n=1 Tax=Geoalkalibacter halelectricus TaxID=2847045 RepID=A0ABY5ZJX9_9BACT|nr:sigma 54-interacting transcriptional regulator [Geoalkalibacter halelectricus]MDO3380286.1 sigma 54-interacting transcriptional regulator [Geoalkalibacter halelectricus]UWZ79438.1 sigma 54-interacting transcriptional regulator [Geoalkalibacter halelectricus]